MRINLLSILFYFLFVFINVSSLNAVVIDTNDKALSKKALKRQSKVLKKELKIELRKLRHEKCLSRKKLKAKKKQDELKNDYRKIQPFSLLSFIFLFVPFLGPLGVPFAILGSICIILSPIFAIIGLSRIKKEPHRFKGKGFSIATLVIYGLAILLSVIFLIILFATLG